MTFSEKYSLAVARNPRNNSGEAHLIQSRIPTVYNLIKSLLPTYLDHSFISYELFGGEEEAYTFTMYFTIQQRLEAFVYAIRIILDRNDSSMSVFIYLATQLQQIEGDLEELIKEYEAIHFQCEDFVPEAYAGLHFMRQSMAIDLNVEEGHKNLLAELSSL